MARYLCAVLGALITLASVSQAWAQTNTLQSRVFARFRAGDKCIVDATKAFPDHDLISLQKRDGQVDQCLADHKLPPRAHLAPSSATPTIVEPPKDN